METGNPWLRAIQTQTRTQEQHSKTLQSSE